MTFSNPTPNNYVIKAAALTVTASAQSKTYGQTVTFGSGSKLFTSSGLQNGQTIGSVTLAVSGSGGAATAAVGSYTITASAATGGTFTASNYTITYATGTLTVNTAALTVRPNAVSTTYSGVALNNTTYSDTTGNYSITGFQNGQTITSAGVTLSGSMAFKGSTSTSVENVGAYTQAVGTLALGSSNNNYSMTFSNPTPNNYVIKAAALTVRPNAVSTTYSGVALNNTTYSDTTGNYSITGFQNGQTISTAGVTLSGSMAFNGSTSTSVENVGTYTQAVGTLALGSSNNNYSMTFSNPTPNNYVIKAAALTVTASAQSKTYGQTVTFGSDSTQFTSSGLQNGQTIGSVTLAVSNNGGAATAAAGGSYTITPSAATGGTFTSATGSGNDMLIGGSGKQTLTDTGTGHNILNGGPGVDTLTGKGNDILISGTTNYDSNTSANIAALDAILAEWSSSDLYSTRISKIMSGVGPGFTDALNSSTCQSDGVANTVSDGASTTQNNWFIVNSKDKVTKKGNETETIV
jgi:hypothetical protein